MLQFVDPALKRRQLPKSLTGPLESGSEEEEDTEEECNSTETSPPRLPNYTTTTHAQSLAHDQRPTPSPPAIRTPPHRRVGHPPHVSSCLQR